MSAWIQHIKKIQAETGCSYKDAMKQGKGCLLYTSDAADE